MLAPEPILIHPWPIIGFCRTSPFHADFTTVSVGWDFLHEDPAMAIVERADRPDAAAAGNPNESWQADAARDCNRVYGDKCRTTGSVAPNEVSIVTNNGTVA